MGCELQILVWSIYWGMVQILLAAAFATAQRGIQWNMSPRDASTPPLTGVAGRLDRALQNFKETFPFFAAAVLIVVLTEKSTSLSQTGAGIYLVARIVYVPIYAMGIPMIRSLVWLASLIGIILILAATAVSCAAA